MIFRIRKEDDHIKLGQLLKALNLVSSGSEAKIRISDGEVMVNDEVCLMRGKKIRPGDRVSFNGEVIEVS